MATITIQNLGDDLVARLRLRANRSGRSIEDEACKILRAALAVTPEEDGSGAALYAAIRARVEPLAGVELELPPRT